MTQYQNKCEIISSSQSHNDDGEWEKMKWKHEHLLYIIFSTEDINHIMRVPAVSKQIVAKL